MRTKKLILSILVMAFLTITVCFFLGCSDSLPESTDTSTDAPTNAATDADALTVDDITFSDSDTKDSVTSNFTLPVTGEVNSTTTITWTSGNTDVITIEGDVATVTRPVDAYITVELTATLKDTDGNTVTKTISVTVKCTALILSGEVTTLAGSTKAGSADGTGTDARFKNPIGIATDGTNLYVTDYSNYMIRKIGISSGVVTTIAGSTTAGSTDGTGTDASFRGPTGAVIDGNNLYVSDCQGCNVRKIVLSSTEVTTYAGSTEWSSGYTDGTGTEARFSYPLDITTDGTNLYVSDSESDKYNMIRKIVISTGEVTTLAGSDEAGSVNGTGTDARFDSPWGITTDGTNLYVSDSANNMIRKIVISSGVVTTLAGSTEPGSADGIGTDARFHSPWEITTDGTNLYVADCDNNMIRKIVISSGVVTTLAGSTTAGSADGTGTAASFHSPCGITTDGTSLYVADYDNNMIRKID
ncbi:MAG: hypothetical protein PQJ46_00085 [Spirochaetales bacterium]|nr:hypothetical protein [Spirochaetales bacterium]